MGDASTSFSIVNDVIMASLLLLKITYVCANFLDFFRHLTIKYFSLYVYFEGNLDSANKFNNMTSSYDIMSIKSCPEVGND